MGLAWILVKLYDMDAFLCAYTLYYIATYYLLVLIDCTTATHIFSYYLCQ